LPSSGEWALTVSSASLAQASHPDTLGRGLAQMDPPGAAPGDGQRHSLVVFAIKNSHASGRAQISLLQKFEKRGIFLVHAQNFVRVPYFRLGKPQGAMLAAKTGHSSQKRNAVRASAVASESFKQQVRDFGRNAVFEAFGLFMRARPFQTDNFREKFFSEAMPKNKMLCRSLPFCRELDSSVPLHAQIAVASHAFQGRGHGRRSYAKVLSKPRADGDLLFLHNLPDGL